MSLKKTVQYKSKNLVVRRITPSPDTQMVEWEYVEIPDGIAVLPIDQDNNIYLVREWRPAWDRYILSIPSGKCNTQSEKKLLRQVHNELAEELGMDAKKITKLISYYVASRVKLEPHLYVATQLYTVEHKKNKEEKIEIVKMTFGQAFELFISKNEKTTSYTLIALLLTKRLLDMNKLEHL